MGLIDIYDKTKDSSQPVHVSYPHPLVFQEIQPFKFNVASLLMASSLGFMWKETLQGRGGKTKTVMKGVLPP